jgi:hypothetical protein
MTEYGRARFLEYISVLENVVLDAMAAANESEHASRPVAKGWAPA